MDFSNYKNNNRAQGNLKSNEMLRSHVDTIFMLGLITKDVRDKLLVMSGISETAVDVAEMVDYIIDIYNLAIDSKKVVDVQKDIVLAETLLNSIDDTLCQKFGQTTIDLLDNASGLLGVQNVNKKLLKEEIIGNIEIVRKKFKETMILDRESIYVIIKMMEQLKETERI